MTICDCDACITLQSLALLASAAGDIIGANTLAGMVTVIVDDHHMSLADYWMIQASVCEAAAMEGYTDSWSPDDKAWFQKPIGSDVGAN